MTRYLPREHWASDGASGSGRRKPAERRGRVTVNGGALSGRAGLHSARGRDKGLGGQGQLLVACERTISVDRGGWRDRERGRGGSSLLISEAVRERAGTVAGRESEARGFFFCFCSCFCLFKGRRDLTSWKQGTLQKESRDPHGSVCLIWSVHSRPLSRHLP